MAGAVASAMLFAFPASAQDSRLSLADRVTRLEQQVQNQQKDQGTTLVNQITDLQRQLRDMQGQIEVLQHQLQQLDDKGKAQYIDLDSRLSRLEQGSGAAQPGSSATAGNAGAQAGAAVAAGAQAGAAVAAGAAAAGSQVAPPSSQALAADNALSPADSANAEAAYNVAFQSIRKGDYAAASREFRAFVKQYPDHPLAPNAWYWLGESYYVTTNYPIALAAFQHVVEQFPTSEKGPDALLKVGYTELELKQDAKGKATLSKVVAKYPGTTTAKLAKERLARLQRGGH